MGNSVIPLFDSLTHVTVDGRWFHTKYDASVVRLLKELDDAAPYRACVVSISGYNMPNSFVLDVCAKHPDKLVPVAGLNPNCFEARKRAFDKLRLLRNQGFRAVKVHPTLCNVHLDTINFDWLMEACEHEQMPVFLCTIFRRRNYVPSCPPIDLVYRTFVRHSGVRVLFLHSGMTDLLSYADLVGALPNSLMDLSYTLMKYAGSSFDLDFRFLFEKLDEKCVVGSDFPEFSLRQIRCRTAAVGKGLPEEKLEKIYWRNLSTFLGMESNTDEN